MQISVGLHVLIGS